MQRTKKILCNITINIIYFPQQQGIPLAYPAQELIRLSLVQTSNCNKNLSHTKNNWISSLFANISIEVTLSLHILALQIVFEPFCYVILIKRLQVYKQIRLPSQPVTLIKSEVQKINWLSISYKSKTKYHIRHQSTTQKADWKEKSNNTG